MADVSSNLYDWSTTAASNGPLGSATIGTGLDDNLREIQAVIRANLASVGANIASATTTDLGAVPGLQHTITGTTTITSFGTVSAGIPKVLVFSGILTLTHNGTSLRLPGEVNITTAANDTAIFVSQGSGNWRCVSYTRATGVPTTIIDFVTTLSVTSNTTLTIADGYQTILAGGGGTFTITMPDTATLPEGWYVRIVNNGAILTIDRSASDTFVGPLLAVATTTSFTLPYTGAAELGYNAGAVTLYKFSTSWRPAFDSISHGSQLFTGSGTWTCPFGVNTVWLSGAGAGGGGGGANATGAGGGGGGGASIIKGRISVVPSTAYTVTIPTGGTAGSSGGGNGGDGGDTLFGVLLTLDGGAGGGGGTGAAGTAGAQGGGGGGSGSNGSIISTSYWGGPGGGSIWGSSGQTWVNAGGIDGAGYGGGGSGAGGNAAGGAGAPGFLLVEW